MEQERVLVSCQNPTPKHLIDFYNKLSGMFKRGWTVLEPKSRYEAPQHLPYPTVVLVRSLPESIVVEDVVQPPTITTKEEIKEDKSLTLKAVLSGLSKIGDMRQFAKDNKIEIPSDVKGSDAIKEFIDSKL